MCAVNILELKQVILTREEISMFVHYMGTLCLFTASYRGGRPKTQCCFTSF